MAIRKAYADTPAGQVHYRFQEGPGTALVFLHRTPSSSVSFEPVMAAMDGERAIYAFDTPGFGGSFDPTGPADISDYRDWMLAAIDAAGIARCHLYGHHTGTHIAAEIAAARPGLVASLMLNGVAYLDDAEREQFRSQVGTAPQPDPEGAYLLPVFQLMKSLFPAWNAELVHREFTGAMRSTHTRDFAFQAIWNQDFPAVLSQTRCPVLALSCSDDFFAPYLDRVPQGHPGAKTVVQGQGIVAAPEWDTDNPVRIVRDFINEVENG